jgi:hypothetical protein
LSVNLNIGWIGSQVTQSVCITLQYAMQRVGSSGTGSELIATSLLEAKVSLMKKCVGSALINSVMKDKQK